MPNMWNYLDCEVCIVFGCALLWRFFYEKQFGGFIHEQIIQRVTAAYAKLGDHNTLENKQNLIAKLPLKVTGIDAQLLIDVILVEPNNDGNDNQQNVQVDNRMQEEEVRLLATQVMQLWRSIADVANDLEHLNLNSHMILCQINCNLFLLVVTSGCTWVGNYNAGHERPAELFKNPRTFHVLWVKWEFGIKGNKTAKLFTAQERGWKEQI